MAGGPSRGKPGDGHQAPRTGGTQTHPLCADASARPYVRALQPLPAPARRHLRQRPCRRPPRRPFPLAVQHLPGRRRRRARHSRRDRRLDRYPAGRRRRCCPACARRRSPPSSCPSASVDGLRWAIPKADRLVIPTGAVATMSHIPDRVRQRRGNRDYIVNRLYVRLAARLGPVSKAEAQRVPPLEPVQALRQHRPGRRGRPPGRRCDERARSSSCWAACCRARTARSSTAEEVAELVMRAPCGGRGGRQAETRRGPGGTVARRAAGRAVGQGRARAAAAQHDRAQQVGLRDRRCGRRHRRPRGQGHQGPARRYAGAHAGAPGRRALAGAGRCRMRPAARFPDGALTPGQEMQVTLVPSVVRANRMEPIRFSVFGEGQEHKVTVTRNAAGEFVASALADRRAHRAGRSSTTTQAQASSLYASIYNTAATAGHPARRDPADPQDPRLRDGLPPARARRRRVRVLLRH